MTKLILRTLLASFITLFILNITATSHAFFGSSDTKPTSYQTITEMSDAMAAELRQGHAGKALYLDKEDIRDATDGNTYSFSSQLFNELERAFSKAGFGFHSRDIDKADLGLAAEFRRTGDSVSVYLKLKDIKGGSAYRTLKGVYEIPLAKLPGSFDVTLDERIDRLATKVTSGWQRTSPQRLTLTPMVDARRRYSSPFAEYVTRKLKARLATDSLIRLLEEKPAIKKEATRPLAAPLAAGDAALVGADASFEGTCLRGNSSVSVEVKVKGADGVVKSYAEESIPLEIVSYSTANDTADNQAAIADTEHEAAGDMVSIATIKGGGHRIFRKGEQVQFSVRVAKPLYIYLYSINPEGEVNLIYPREGQKESPFTPGTLRVIPDERDSWEIIVEPPFGTDAVKLFASAKRLPLPHIEQTTASRSFNGTTRTIVARDKIQKELALRETINGRDLVDWYKGTAKKANTQLFESTVIVETREQ